MIVWTTTETERRPTVAKQKKSKMPLTVRASDDYVQAMLGLRSSNAAGKHADKRSKRARTRAAQTTRALKDW